MNSSQYTLIPGLPSHATSLAARWRKLAFSLLALTVATATFAAAPFSSIVVFGDSVSDAGRLFKLTDGKFPPRIAYFDGRQSNGPVWVEYLAFDLGLEGRLKDYAVCGATTGSDVSSGNVLSSTYPDANLDGTSLGGQLALFLRVRHGKLDPDALYIVQGGANDLIDPLSGLLLNPPATTDEFLAAVNEIATPTVTNIATMVGTLKRLGAKYIAVVNVPDFGKAPRLVQFGPVASSTVSMVVEIVNEAVGAQLDGIDAAGGNKIARVDIFGLVDSIVAHPANYAFTNVTGQFMTLDPATKKVTYAAERFRAGQWLFWDDLHPTTRGHEFLAQSALGALRVAFPSVIGHHHP